MAFYLGLSADSFHATVCGLSVCLCVRARARGQTRSRAVLSSTPSSYDTVASGRC